MSTTPVFDELKNIMTDALLQMTALTESGATQRSDFLAMTKLFLISIISTAASIAETTAQGSAPWLFAEIEAAAKHAGTEAIMDITSTHRQYSIADMPPDDIGSGMNYIGQQLSATLFKSIHELPTNMGPDVWNKIKEK